MTLGFESYISKAKIHKQERETKRVKRSRDEAKECLFRYWSEIENEAPVTRNEAIEMKERILQLVQDGASPEEAFSQELLRLLSGKQRATPISGYVYIGEYINSETGQPLFEQLKIGYTTNLMNRASTLSGGVAGPLEFNMKYHWEFDSDVAYAIEQALHGRFSQYRKKGEFFSNPSLLLTELVDDEITQNYGELLKASNLE